MTLRTLWSQAIDVQHLAPEKRIKKKGLNQHGQQALGLIISPRILWTGLRIILVVLELMLSVSDERLRAPSLSLVGKRWAADRRRLPFLMVISYFIGALLIPQWWTCLWDTFFFCSLGEDQHWSSSFQHRSSSSCWSIPHWSKVGIQTGESRSRACSSLFQRQDRVASRQVFPFLFPC